MFKHFSHQAVPPSWLIHGGSPHQIFLYHACLCLCHFFFMNMCFHVLVSVTRQRLLNVGALKIRWLRELPNGCHG